MTVKIRLADDRRVRVTDEVIETKLPDRITFAVEGIFSVSEGLLAEFEGSTLEPTRIDVSVDHGGIVDIDLTAGASIHLDTVDVGVEAPGPDDVPRLTGTLPTGADDIDDLDTPGAVAFTVEGAILDVSEDTVERVIDASPAFESVTFVVKDALRGDGGADEGLFEFTILGYGIVVRRNGTIEIRSDGSLMVG